MKKHTVVDWFFLTNVSHFDQNLHYLNICDVINVAYMSQYKWVPTPFIIFRHIRIPCLYLLTLWIKPKESRITGQEMRTGRFRHAVEMHSSFIESTTISKGHFPSFLIDFWWYSPSIGLIIFHIFLYPVRIINLTYLKNIYRKL